MRGMRNPPEGKMCPLLKLLLRLLQLLTTTTKARGIEVKILGNIDEDIELNKNIICMQLQKDVPALPICFAYSFRKKKF